MRPHLSLLDEALKLGEQELVALDQDELESVEKLASRRQDLLAKAMGQNTNEDADQLVEKLAQLKAIQGRLSLRTKKLHAQVKRDLQRVREECRRMTGYKDASRVMPMTNRFISKVG